MVKKGVCERLYNYRFKPTATACPLFERKEEGGVGPEQCQFCKFFDKDGSF